MVSKRTGRMGGGERARMAACCIEMLGWKKHEKYILYTRKWLKCSLPKAPEIYTHYTYTPQVKRVWMWIIIQKWFLMRPLTVFSFLLYFVLLFIESIAHLYTLETWSNYVSSIIITWRKRYREKTFSLAFFEFAFAPECLKVADSRHITYALAQYVYRHYFSLSLSVS